RGGDDLEQSFSGRPKLFRLGLSKPVGFADPKNVKRRNQQFKEMFEKYGEAAKKGLSSGPAYESAETPDTTYRDGYHAAGAAAHLREFAKTGQSFFLALGLYKPHLNFVAPKKYWDLYDPEKLPAGTYTPAPKNGASMGLHASFELRVRDGIPKIGPIDEKLSRTLFHASKKPVSIRTRSSFSGETTDGTSVTWEFGEKPPTMKSPPEFPSSSQRPI
ncbi:MAG: hypothetical protein ACPGAP_10255, partial [Akkermansiaceae bacterium]